MTERTLLYVEDDETLAFLTKDNLEQNQYKVIHCKNGKEAIDTFRQHRFDLCILDIMLPEKDGFEVATEIRMLDQEVPIIFLSAKALKEDRIKGLKIGADDYMVKPFSIEELILKIEIFLNRAKKTVLNNSSLHFGKFSFDIQNYSVTINGETEMLTQREAALLRLFVENKDKVLTREQILLSVWGSDDYFLGRSMDVFISRLRKILSRDPLVQIETLHGIGFRFLVKNQ
jgi:DNA-binding response OmpR family regulator